MVLILGIFERYNMITPLQPSNKKVKVPENPSKIHFGVLALRLTFSIFFILLPNFLKKKLTITVSCWVG